MNGNVLCQDWNRGGQGLDRELQPNNAPHPVLSHRMEEGSTSQYRGAMGGIDLSRELPRG